LWWRRGDKSRATYSRQQDKSAKLSTRQANMPDSGAKRAQSIIQRASVVLCFSMSDSTVSHVLLGMQLKRQHTFVVAISDISP